MAVMCVGFVSCSSDDDKEGSGSASTSAGVIDKKTGLRVKAFGDYKVYYLDDGRIDYIRDNYGKWSFSYSPNKISFTETYNGYNSDEEVIRVSYNSSGYLSSTSFSDSGLYDGEKWTESSEATLSYDGNGHLTKIAGSGKASGTEKGYTYNDTWTFSYTLTWRNNLLLQVVWTEKETGNGEIETETETWSFAYENDSYENEYKQWTPSITQWLDDIEEFFAYVGLLGVGPKMLPSSAEKYEEEYYDGKMHTDEDSYWFGYGFNKNGAVSYSSINSTRYDFSYDYAEINSKNTRSDISQERERGNTLHRLFKRSRIH